MSDLPTATGATGLEAKQIHELVEKEAQRDGIRTFKLNFGEDSTGSAAVWISFILDPNYETSPSNIQALVDLQTRVKKSLFANGLDRVPYVRFRDISDAAE